MNAIYTELFLVNNTTMEKREDFFLFFVLLITWLLCQSIRSACYSAVLLKIVLMENTPWTSRHIYKPPLDGEAAFPLLTSCLQTKCDLQTCCNVFSTVSEYPSIQALKYGWSPQSEAKLLGMLYLQLIFIIYWRQSLKFITQHRCIISFQQFQLRRLKI